MKGEPDFALNVERQHAKVRAEENGKIGRLVVREGSEFCQLADDHYRLVLPAIHTVFEIDRLRRERGQLMGELSITCNLPGARTFDGNLSLADLNLSNAQARIARATMLAIAANTGNTLDWISLVEEFCQRVLRADRIGKPAVDLRDVPRPAQDEVLSVDGFTVPRRHPSILFGDGGTSKSYLGLYFAGRLAQRGMRVALFDWELAGDDHRDRLERLFGPDMPQVLYAKCDRPLVHEVDRLARIVRDSRVDYALFDSVAFACDGPPEAAEVAGRYFRAVRQIGCGSLHVAHVSKAEGADQKPFGSTFWHNGGRCTWYIKLANANVDSSVLDVGLFNRKANLGRIRSPIGFTVTFTEERTTFTRADVADNPDLAGQLNVRQRMYALLRKGAMSPEQVAEEIEAELETVKRTARRCKNVFVVLPNGKYGLLDKTA